jgi:hypothetical protein
MKDAGISMTGLEDLSASLIRNGTAIPIKEIGPANAVTQADNRLDKVMIRNLHNLTLTPTLLA